MKTPNTSQAGECQNPAAFTFVELLVVVTMLLLCSLLLIPALGRTKTDGRAFQCLNHNRELNRAWRMWTDDNGDKLLAIWPNSEAVPRWIIAESASNPNWDPAAEILNSPLWPYCGTNVNIWKCPSDDSYVLVNGLARPRLRNFAMNSYLGPPPNFYFAPLYRNFRKLAEITDPPPSGLFVFLDMRADAINYGNFDVIMDGYSPRNPAAYKFADLPGANHDAATSFSYVDGHGEIHRWLDPRTAPPLVFFHVGGNTQTPSPRNPDIGWLQDRATRPK